MKKNSKKIKVIKPEIEQTQTNEIKITSHDISSASPKARKFARELGVDISQVVGSEKDGRVIEDDIKKFVSSRSKDINETKDNKTSKIKNEFEHSDFGEIEIKDIPRVKKIIFYLSNQFHGQLYLMLPITMRQTLQKWKALEVLSQIFILEKKLKLLL